MTDRAGVAGVVLAGGAVIAGIVIACRSRWQLGAPWVLPEPESRAMQRCFRSASREARPRTYGVKSIAVRALLDANPKLLDLVERDCGGDCKAYTAWVNGGRRGPKPRARSGDGRFDALNERFEKRTPGRKIASWREALDVTAPRTRHWEDFAERLPVLEEAVGFRLSLPDRAEAPRP
jgi:hypothetical protein